MNSDDKRYDVDVTVRVAVDAYDPHEARERALDALRSLTRQAPNGLPFMGAITRLGPVSDARKQKARA